jgi:hypothetical protein
MEMEATVIVTFFALAQYSLFGIQVGSLRAKYDVIAPSQTGHEQFERMNRVHLNTLEQLVVFIPALWMHALYANPFWGARPLCKSVLGSHHRPNLHRRTIYLQGRVFERSCIPFTGLRDDVHTVGGIACLDARRRDPEHDLI